MTSGAVYKVEPGSIVVIASEMEDETVEKLTEELARITDHDRFLVLHLPPDGVARVFGQDELREALEKAFATS